MFIDADIGFEPSHVLRLINHNKDIVCGAYPMKTIPLRYNYNITQPPRAEGGLVEIENIGFGFALIHRRVFEGIIQKFGSNSFLYSTKTFVDIKSNNEKSRFPLKPIFKINLIDINISFNSQFII